MNRCVLSIDTSTAVSVAAHGGSGWAVGGTDDPRGHTENVAPLVQRVLASAGLTPGDDPRTLRFTPVGARWIGAGLRPLLTAPLA